MSEVAERAEIELGALPALASTRDLIASVLRVATDGMDMPPTGDLEVDVVHGLVLRALPPQA